VEDVTAPPKPKRVRKPKEAKPIQNPILDDDIVLIKHYFEKWRKLFGLMDWRITYPTKRAKGDLLGWVEMFLDARLARVHLGESWGRAPAEPGDHEKFAMHELNHVLNKEMLAFAVDHQSSVHEDVLSAEHRQINIMEELLFNAYGDKVDGQTPQA